jgi:hypothetical protein
MRKALMSALILTPLLQACALFAGGPPTVTTSAAGCSSLVPQEWRQPVEGADPPPEAPTIADLSIFGDQQTGRLDMANDRTLSTIGIVERCEARDAAAVRRATRRRGLFG